MIPDTGPNARGHPRNWCLDFADTPATGISDASPNPKPPSGLCVHAARHQAGRRPIIMQVGANEAIHRMSGTHFCSRFEWPWMPLIGDLDR